MQEGVYAAEGALGQETRRLSVGMQLNKHTMEYEYSGILYNRQNEWTIISLNMRWMNIILNEELKSQKHILYNMIPFSLFEVEQIHAKYTTFLELIQVL